MTARDRILVLVLAGAAILAGFWFAVLKPKKAEERSLATQLASQRARLQTAEATVATGQEAKSYYPRDAATIAQLGKAVPADDDLASLMYQLQNAARGARVDFASLVRAAATGSGSSAPAASGSSATPPAANGSSSTANGSSSSTASVSSSSTASGSSSSTASGSSSSTASGASSSTASGSSSSTASGSPGASSSTGTATGATAATGTPAVTAALPPGATVGTAGLATLPFTFNFKGSFFELQRLLAGVQGFVRVGNGSVVVRGRLLSVDGVSLVAGSNGMSDLEAKVVATAYLSPETPAPVAGTGATTGIGSASSSATNGSASSAAPTQTSSAITTGTS